MSHLKQKSEAIGVPSVDSKIDIRTYCRPSGATTHMNQEAPFAFPRLSLGQIDAIGHNTVPRFPKAAERIEAVTVDEAKSGVEA